MGLFDRLVSLTLPVVPKPIVGYFSRKYIAGSTTADAFATVRTILDQGAMTTLDILGEFITTRQEAEANTAAYCRLVEQVAEEGLPETNVSLKLTALGLTQDPSLCLDNVRRLMETVQGADNFLRIDMEDSPYTDSTLDIYRTLRREYGEKVGVVLQSRLRRTRQDVVALTDEPLNVRLCKGIYLEPRPIAYTDRELIQKNFTAVLDLLFQRGAYVGIATHDELLVWDALELIARHGLTPEQYEFQMLLGVDEQLRRIILDAGHRLRVYVPYGEQWYAYSVRRLRENPQIAGHALRAMLRRGS